MDKSPIVAYYATVSDRSVGSVGRVDVVDGDVEQACAQATRLIEAWEGAQVATFGNGASVALATPTPHTEARGLDAARENNVFVDWSDDDPVPTQRAPKKE